MTIALRAAGTATSATAAVTAINPSVPTGTTTGDLSVLSVAMKPYSTTITTPSGWTKIGEATNGTTASGTDTGSTKIAVFVKESAAVGAIGNITFSGANTVGAVINSYSKASDKAWDYSVFTSGGDTTNGANYSATGSAGLDVTAGDLVCASTAVNGDIGTLSAITIAGMSGATLGTYASRQNAAVTTGNDCRLVVGDRPVTSGSSNAAPTVTYTNASSTSGTSMWLRLREVALPTNVRLGLNSAQKLYVGTTEAVRAFLGTILFWGTYSGISFVSESHTTYASRSTTTSLTVPTLAANDYVLLVYLAGQSSAPADPTSIPSGFSLLEGPVDVSSEFFHVSTWIYAKFATGSEPSTWDFGEPTTRNTQAFAVVYRGVNQTTPLDATTVLNQSNGSNGTTYTYSSITTVSNNACVVVLGLDWGDTANDLTPPSGMTERVDTSIIYCADVTQPTAGASGDKTMTTNSTGGDPWFAATIALRPA